MKNFSNNKGFTLIELIVVVAIMAILAAVAVPSYNNIQEKAEISAAKANATTIASACNVHNALSAVADDVIVEDINDLTTVSDFNDECTQSTVSLSDDDFVIAVEYLMEGVATTDFLVNPKWNHIIGAEES